MTTAGGVYRKTDARLVPEVSRVEPFMSIQVAGEDYGFLVIDGIVRTDSGERIYEVSIEEINDWRARYHTNTPLNSSRWPKTGVG
jgi:hypothetical protein